MSLITNSAFFMRYCKIQLKPRHFLVFFVIYAIVAGLIIFSNYTSVQNYKDYHYEHGAHVPVIPIEENIFTDLFFLQVFLFFIWSAYNSYDAISEEVKNRSIDFFRIFPIPAPYKALSLLTGRNSAALIISFINICLMSGFAYAAKYQISSFILMTAVLAVTALFVNLGVFLVSSFYTSIKRSSGIVVFLFLILLIIGPSYFGILVSTVNSEFQYMYPLFSWWINIGWIFFVFFASLSVWTALGIIRRFNNEYEPLFTLRTAAAFFSWIFLFCIAVLWESIRIHNRIDIGSFLYFLLFSLFAVCMGSLRHHDRYIETVRKKNCSFLTFFKETNLFRCLWLYIMFATLYAPIAYLFKINISEIFYSEGVLASFFIPFLLLLELYTVYSPQNSRIQFILAFIAFLLLFIPHMIAATLDYQYLTQHSMTGFIRMFACSEKCMSPYIIVVNIIIIWLMLMPLRRRYKKLFLQAIEEKNMPVSLTAES